VSAFRFWVREIWSPQWDRERRRLLIQHYWSYLRHPAPLPVYLPEADPARVAAQQAFSAAYRRRITSVHEQASRRRGVRLTFRPLGKNLRLLGTAVRRNVDAGYATFIEPDGPPTEVASLRSQGHAWHPWLWSRTGQAGADARFAADAARAWGEFFRMPGDHDDNRGELSQPPRAQLPALHRQVERVLKLAAATRYIFRPTATIEAQVAAHKHATGWPAAPVPVLGMHVRRSDAASSEPGGPSRSTRPSFALLAYLEAADQLCAAYGIRHIFLASESAVEIERARTLRPQYTFLSLPHDRAIFPDIAATKQFVEYLALASPDRARAIATSAILDLRMFCDCTAFVGAFNSEFSVLAWLLTLGSRGHVIPYVSLSEPRQGLALHPRQALLNVQNNCPLELYHW
jgi:hypothetical protein